MKKTAVLICPGRGTYNQSELGYLEKYHSHQSEFISWIDQRRKDLGQVSITDLDSAKKFDFNQHTKGENAAALIYACSYLDYLAINRQEIDIVAVTGNSMGWYLALACADALKRDQAFDLINTMGSMMKEGLIGGQLIYPVVNDDWTPNRKEKQKILQIVRELNQQEGYECDISIFFGGYLVIGGNEQALQKLMKELPKKQERFPFRMKNNAAFHTTMLYGTSVRAKEILNPSLFQKPKLSMIDGRAHLWHPLQTKQENLWNYTLGHQIYLTYDFSLCISMALKEYNPDYLILTGPGTTMGGAIGQAIVANSWRGIVDKNSFIETQKKNPLLISMGDEVQRKIVT